MGPVSPPPPTPPAAGYYPPPADSPEQKKKVPTWVKALAIVGGLFVVMIIGCAALVGTAVNEAGKELKNADSGDASDKSEIKARVGLNEPLTLKGTTYQVTSARTSPSVGDRFTGAKANGMFLIVDVTLTNKKNEPATILGDSMRVVGGNKAVYSISDDALLAVDNQFILEEIQPGVTESGTLVYDLPQAAVRGSELQVEDLFSDDKGRVALGL